MAPTQIEQQNSEILSTRMPGVDMDLKTEMFWLMKQHPGHSWREHMVPAAAGEEKKHLYKLLELK